MNLDPITMEVVLNRLREIAATMEHALYHSGYSPILRESQDGTAGLTDAGGRVVVVSGGLQYHSLPYYHAVQGVLARYPAGTMQEGDCFIVNDPYKGGNPHVPDMIAVTPVFYRGELIAFGVSVAHKPDVGGLVPGSSGAGAREIFHDGLLLPPVRYCTRDGVNEAVEAIIRNNSRVPEPVIGDLRGQVGCTRLGAARLQGLADEYGVETIKAAMAGLLRVTAARLRAELRAWPDGSTEAEGWLDHDGADKETPVRIHVRATKAGDHLTLDFSGSSDQTRGPVNANMPTVQAVSLLAVLAATDPTIPMNAGLLDAVQFVIPPRKVVSPQFPATMNHYFPTSHLVYNCVLAALGQLNPVRAVAPSGLGTGAIAIGYPRARSGKPMVQYELLITSLGGTSEHDGASIVLGMNHYTPSTPVEVVETEYPIVVRRFDIWPDSAGAGRQRGGIGFIREYQALEDCVLTVRLSNHRYGAWGLLGGKGPLTSRTLISADDREWQQVGPIETCQLQAGSVVRLQQSGGAGYGDPFERSPEQVLEDVQNGYVSPSAAAEEYRVVVDPRTGTIDRDATRARRGRDEHHS
ncbi:MAG: hydantoinase B/oxoprolinase family protein [Deltaproteobacteria bacterium]|nr:hydantoinase B/oxoprolinase family protein [Deltaproteobacteria bacterium]MBI3075677.1 hydantoinase B/oxoprolinase family protein [Deltaproteobacteria bacterium]